jgi:hypothetical protein
MIRQNPLDRAVIANAHGLNFIVLDEIHTYRGRQGADVAMPVRRARDRLCPEKFPICIGTSERGDLPGRLRANPSRPNGGSCFRPEDEPSCFTKSLPRPQVTAGF